MTNQGGWNIQGTQHARGEYVLVKGKRKGERRLGIPRCRRNDNVKFILKKCRLGC
jgi:hypothetical protein